MRKLILLTVVLIISTASQIKAQGVCVISERKIPTASGIVLLPNGIPIPEATLELYEKDDGPLIAKTMSDNGGHFSFSGIKSGKYLIKASAPILVPLYVPINVTLKSIPKNKRIELAIILNGLIGKPCGGGEVELRECTIK